MAVFNALRSATSRSSPPSRISSSSDTLRLKLYEAQPLRDLLVYGVRYVYPAEFGAPARGVATAYSAPAFASVIAHSSPLVWPCDAGEDFGPSLDPIHACVPGASLRHPNFYALMALVDLLRVGRVREAELATTRLDELLGTA